jgi:DMSO/TMAO reductase YedYZ heme-binding membrane subunit
LKKYLQKHWLELVVHLCCVLPLLGLWQAWRTVNPNQALIQTAGRYGIRLLVLSLLVTPLQQLLPRRVSIVPIRKLLGLYGFAYILTHFVVLIGLEYGFLNGSDWGLAWQFLWGRSRYKVVYLDRFDGLYIADTVSHHIFAVVATQA